ncbi:hypothetical protein RJT34_08984 [Clitoria ternatea]|uniref:Uncharacterized protein n=1 Tax=Clitoria ternatea TaxID=43366 RepID=A0AAN9PV63_CLITE
MGASTPATLNSQKSGKIPFLIGFIPSCLSIASCELNPLRPHHRRAPSIVLQCVEPSIVQLSTSLPRGGRRQAPSLALVFRLLI